VTPRCQQHSNTRQHTPTQTLCNTLQRCQLDPSSLSPSPLPASSTSLRHLTSCCSTLQHSATHSNTLQHTITLCNTLQHTPTHSNTPSIRSVVIITIAIVSILGEFAPLVVLRLNVRRRQPQPVGASRHQTLDFRCIQISGKKQKYTRMYLLS